MLASNILDEPLSVLVVIAVAATTYLDAAANAGATYLAAAIVVVDVDSAAVSPA